MRNTKQTILTEPKWADVQAEPKTHSVGPPFWCILALALLLRAALCIHERSHWFNTDTADYLRMAGAIRSHHPYSLFPNGYPLLIAAAEAALPPSAVPAALILANVLMGTAVVAMVYFFTLRLTRSSKPAIVAALVAALYPNQLDYTFQLMTEPPSAFLLSLGILCLLSQRALAAGWWLYLGSTFRATLLLVGPLLLVAGLILRRPKTEMARLAAGIALGWLVFFALEHAHVIKPSSNLNANLLISINGDSRHLDFSYNGAPQQTLRSAPRMYVDFACTHPKEFIRQRAVAFSELWGPFPDGGSGAPDLKPHRSVISRLLIGLRFPFFMLALWAGWTRRRDFVTWMFLTPILLITVLHTLTFATPRFSYPVEPLVISLAVTAAFDWRCGRRGIKSNGGYQ